MGYHEEVAQLRAHILDLEGRVNSWESWASRLIGHLAEPVDLYYMRKSLGSVMDRVIGTDWVSRPVASVTRGRPVNLDVEDLDGFNA